MILLQGDFKVPKTPLASVTLRKWQHSNIKQDGAFIYRNKGCKIAHWVAFAFDAILIHFFSFTLPAVFIFKATPVSTQEQRYPKQSETL